MLRESKDKWTKLVTELYPRDSKRNRCIKIKRWEDDFKKIAGLVWTRLARGQKYVEILEAFVVRRALWQLDVVFHTNIQLPIIQIQVETD